MFNLFQKDSLRVVSKSKKVVKRGRRKTLSKRTKVMNLLSKGGFCSMENAKN